MTERPIERLERQHRDIYPCPKPSGKLVGGGKPKTRKPLKKTRMRCGAGSKRRKGHMFPKNVDEARRDFIRAQRCALTNAATGEWIQWRPWMPQTWKALSPWKCFVVVAHVKTRGSGGADRNNMIPLESRLHEWQETIGWKALVKKLKLEAPAEIAAEYERRYLREAA